MNGRVNQALDRNPVAFPQLKLCYYTTIGYEDITVRDILENQVLTLPDWRKSPACDAFQGPLELLSPTIITGPRIIVYAV